jgi:large subunit ribosomal protein L6
VKFYVTLDKKKRRSEMSRVGKKQIQIPKDVKVQITGSTVNVTGKHGTLERTFDPQIITIEQGENTLDIKCLESSKKNNSYYGLMRALIQNMVTGVSEQFTKTLVAEGVGYKFQVDKNNLIISAGYSHPVEFPIPEDLKLTTESPTKLLITGIDKERVGFLASKIHDVRPPEPYKGKGLLYLGEKIVRKAGKTGK